MPGPVPAPPSVFPQPTRGRILVIDDDEWMCQTLRLALVRRGFSVTSATSGVEGLELLGYHPFDVVLTDLEMDGLDGLAVCQLVTERHFGVPVVVLTAFGTAESAALARLAGAYGFLDKPFDLNQLRAVLAEAVAHGRATRSQGPMGH